MLAQAALTVSLESSKQLESLQRIRDLTRGQDLSLPQIVVVGGQSSGKSSLLTELIHLSRVVVPPWQIPKGYASDLLLQHPAARDARRLKVNGLAGRPLREHLLRCAEASRPGMP